MLSGVLNLMKIRKGHKYSGVIAQIVVSAFASLEAKGALLYTSGLKYCSNTMCGCLLD